MKNRIIEFQDDNPKTRWNPTTGCTPNSRGCANCYALGISQRLAFDGKEKYSGGFDVRVHPYTLKKDFESLPPSRIFVDSMSDLFHDDVPEKFIRGVLNVIYKNPRHLFLISTKRAERMHGFNSKGDYRAIKNLILAVTVESNHYIDRIRLLKETSARFKLIFFEPLLENMDKIDLTGIGWAMVGGESGEGCREFRADWARSIRSQCERDGCEFVFKGYGGVNRYAQPALLDDRYYDRIPTVDII